MELKKLHMGTIVFGWDAMDEVTHMLSLALDDEASGGTLPCTACDEMRLTDRHPSKELYCRGTSSRSEGHVNPCH